MENILGRAKRLGIKFEEGVEEHLDRLSELQLLLQDAERERVYLDSGGIDTTLQDEVIAKRFFRFRSSLRGAPQR